MVEKSESTKLSKCLIIFFSLLHLMTVSFCIYLYLENVSLREDVLVADPRKAVTSKSTSETTDPLLPGDKFWFPLDNSYKKNDIQDRHRQKRQALFPRECGGTYYIPGNSEESYVIQSPNYPQAYENKVTCDWMFLLELPEPVGCGVSRDMYETSLKLSFVGTVDIEYCSCNCSYDSLTVRGGSKNGPVIKTICGNNETRPDVVFAGPMHIRFSTDSSITRTGFKAEISVVRKSQPDVVVQAMCAVYRESLGTDGGDSSYTIWGSSTCPYGIRFYEGFGVGIVNASSPNLQCQPFPMHLNYSDTSYMNNSFSSLTPAHYNLSGTDDVFSRDLDQLPVTCALCLTTHLQTLTVSGWNSCDVDDLWTTVYSGYLMSPSYGGKPGSETFCVKRTPTKTPGFGFDVNGPEMKFVKSGEGMWLGNKIMPCAVCVRNLPRRTSS